MDVRIRKANIGGAIDAIASKSHAHRLLICAALAGRPTEITCSETSEDIDATIRCLTGLGAVIQTTATGFHVRPIRSVPPKAELRCGESGSTLRFLLPVACALGQGGAFYGEGRLPQRPLSPLYEELIAHGCTITEQGRVPLICTGRLTSGTYTLPANISSQYISGLLFALPLLNGESDIILTGKLESRHYIEMTLSALKLFGIQPERTEYGFHIPAGAQYTSPGTLNVEGDWSNAAFWLCAGAIGGQAVRCGNLNFSSLQGDKAVVDILRQFGAGIHTDDTSVTVTPQKCHGIEIDAHDIPDLVPILSLVAAVADGRTVIRNAQRLRIKESDRLRTVTETLTALGADIQELPDGLIINGKSQLLGGTVSACADHRIAMTAAIAAIVCRTPVTITGAGAVNKSYPRFFEDFKALGGELEIYE